MHRRFLVIDQLIMENSFSVSRLQKRENLDMASLSNVNLSTFITTTKKTLHTDYAF